MTTVSTLEFADPFALAAALQRQFKGGIAKLSARAGWTTDDAKQQCWLAAHDAIENFDSARGELMPRAWSLLRRAALKSGFIPSCCRDDDKCIETLELVAAGDDPAAIIAAAEEIGQRLLVLGAGVEREGPTQRTARRWRAKARGAAEALLRGGAQGELF